MMRIDKPKSSEWSQDLLDRAVEFHGHRGPFMVVGLRMGLTALKLLKARGWFDMTCSLDLPFNTPYSCVIDGVQVATGCTMGKRNIEVRDREGITGKFITENRRIRLRLRPKFLGKIRENLDLSNEEATGTLMEEIIEATDLSLFEIF